MQSPSNVPSFPVNLTWSPCFESVFLICSSARKGRDIERENLKAKRKGKEIKIKQKDGKKERSVRKKALWKECRKGRKDGSLT
jgi:hypothetical protein